MVDTERMARVLRRTGAGGPPPPPPDETMELLCRERELWELCRPAGPERIRARLRQLRRASARRQERLRRMETLERWGRVPPPPPPPPDHGGTLSRLRRAWRLAGELEEWYARAADRTRDRQRRRIFHSLSESAARSRDELRDMLERV